MWEELRRFRVRDASGRDRPIVYEGHLYSTTTTEGAVRIYTGWRFRLLNGPTVAQVAPGRYRAASGEEFTGDPADDPPPPPWPNKVS